MLPKRRWGGEQKLSALGNPEVICALKRVLPKGGLTKHGTAGHGSIT